jgi:aerobic-type carbon monoxide dehydrogenase small subunit (CoxS/CutS family)
MPDSSRPGQGRKILFACEINGRALTLEAYPMARLLDVLREQAGLTGTKEGCGEGECGACAVEFNRHSSRTAERNAASARQE